MPSVKFVAQKLSEAQVSHISLVERGANRFPFKIVKQEQSMAGKMASLDLGNLFTRKSEKPQVQIVGVVTQKGEGLESIKAQLIEAGFSVADQIDHEDGSVVFKQDGDINEGSAVIRLSDHVAVVTKGFSPYSMDVSEDGISFADACSAKGFYPGINSITETLGDSIRSLVYASSSPSDAKAAVAKMFAEAATYTAAFLSSLPVKAFKLEGMVPVHTTKAELEMAPEDMPEAEAIQKGFKPFVKATAKKLTPEEQATADAAEAAKKAKPATDKKAKPAEAAATDPKAVTDPLKAKKDDGEGTDDGEGDAAKVAKTDESLTGKQVSDIVTAEVGKAVEAMTTQMNDALAGFSEVAKSLKGLTESITGLDSRMSEAEKVAKSAHEAVTGRVVSGSETGDPEPVTKKETQSFRDIDTAFQPRRAFGARS